MLKQATSLPLMRQAENPFWTRLSKRPRRAWSLCSRPLRIAHRDPSRHSGAPRTTWEPPVIRALFGLALFLAAAPAAAQEPSRLDKILQSGTLRVGTTGDYKPFTALDKATGQFSGF